MNAYAPSFVRTSVRFAVVAALAALAILLPLLRGAERDRRTSARTAPTLDPLACAQVIESGTPSVPEYRGVEYRGRVGPAGFRFEGDATWIETRAVRLEQGARAIDGADGIVERAEFGVARIDRGVLVEEYRFENRRAEQLFRIPEPVGAGAMRIRIAVATELTGPVTEVRRGEGGWRETPLIHGGLVFHDAAGQPKLAYHSAVAFDGAGRRIDLDPRYEDGAIVLEVPEAFMALATFPIVVDPWFELAFSATAGGVSGNAGVSNYARLRVDSAGRPIVAWSDDTSGNNEIYVRRWTGTAWAELAGSATGGGMSATAGSSMDATLALDASGNPVVAWADSTSGNYEIYLRRWNGTAWVELGGSATGGGISGTAGPSGQASLALDAAGNPVVAWVDNPGNQEIYLRGWNGSAWVELAGSGSGGGVSATGGLSGYPSLALDGAGNPIVAWHDATPGNYEIFLKRWTGAAWVEVGTSATGGGISSNAGISSVPSLALDSMGNPVVAWDDTTSGSRVYLRRWNGTAWAELAGSATGGGVSATAGNSMEAALALDRAGNPVVAWADDTSVNWQIYLKRWNGAAWIELAGSATLGAISNTGGMSLEPALALDATGCPVVAWHDGTSGNFEIYLKRWSQQAPTGLGQYRTGGATFIATGGTTDESAVVFQGVVSSDAMGGTPPTVGLQVEVRPVGTAFTGTPSGESARGASGSTASFELSGLADGSYHWQGRTVDSLGQGSEWVAFGGNAETDADFVVAARAPATDQVFVEGDKVRFCGATGMEVLVVFVLLGWRRRGRREYRDSA